MELIYLALRDSIILITVLFNWLPEVYLLVEKFRVWENFEVIPTVLAFIKKKEKQNNKKTS